MRPRDYPVGDIRRSDFLFTEADFEHEAELRGYVKQVEQRWTRQWAEGVEKERDELKATLAASDAAFSKMEDRANDLSAALATAIGQQSNPPISCGQCSASVCDHMSTRLLRQEQALCAAREALRGVETGCDPLTVPLEPMAAVRGALKLIAGVKGGR